jgi:hypothetical protein
LTEDCSLMDFPFTQYTGLCREDDPNAEPRQAKMHRSV